MILGLVFKINEIFDLELLFWIFISIKSVKMQIFSDRRFALSSQDWEYQVVE